MVNSCAASLFLEARYEWYISGETIESSSAVFLFKAVRQGVPL